MNNNMVSIFGQPGNQKDASGIMNSNVLNSTSVSSIAPQSQNPNELTKNFGILVWLGYKIQGLDTDPEDAEEIQNLISFAERKYSVLGLQEDEFTDLAPAASPAPPSTPPAPPSPMGGNGTMGAPGQQPGLAIPGMPSAGTGGPPGPPPAMPPAA